MFAKISSEIMISCGSLILLIFFTACKEKHEDIPSGQSVTNEVVKESKDTATTVNYDHDPKTLQEFERLIGDALTNGYTRVSFPSGQYNWNPPLRVELPKEETMAKWSFIDSDGGDIVEQLDKWLRENKVVAVQIAMSSDFSPLTFFKVEEILRERQVHYLVAVRVDTSVSSGFKKKEIKLIETDGASRARSLPIKN